MSVLGRIVSNWFGAQNTDYQVKVTTSAEGDVQHVIVDSGGGASSSTTATRTQVADNAADVLILAANTSRKGASIENDSSAILYLGLGTTAVTTTNYSVRVVQYAYFEVPFNFTGQIRGIWASDPADGGAKITEYS
jgi:hypothetical protein